MPKTKKGRGVQNVKREGERDPEGRGINEV